MVNKKTKILIIEDEKVLSDVLQSKITKEGFDVIAAGDGEDGYNKIKSEKPDLILLDIVMPKMNGYEVMEKMKEDKNNTPVIVISNSGQPVEIEKLKQLGVVDYLIKTKFDPSEVIEKMKKYLSGKKNMIKVEPEIKPIEVEGGAKGGKKVLLVEDDSFLREICSKKLAKEGFSVFEAVDGEQAVKNLEKIEPDIILLDVILPALDGFEVLSQIRSSKNEKVKKTPVIMLSNLGQDDDIEKALKMGATDYMIKAHFTTEEIAVKVKKELDAADRG